MENTDSAKKAEIFRITKPRGLKGEMRAERLRNTDADVVYGEDGTAYDVIAAVRGGGGIYNIKLSGIDTIDKAEAMRGATLYGYGGEDDTERYIGYAAVNAADKTIQYGTVVSAANYGAADVYEVNGTAEYGCFLFAAAPGVITEVDDTGRVLYLTLPDGVFD